MGPDPQARSAEGQSRVKLPPTPTGACGERRGYQRHYRRGEEACPDCMDAWRTRYPENKPKAHEIAEEVDHLISLGQGTYYILKATKQASADALARKLYRLGRHDLASI